MPDPRSLALRFVPGRGKVRVRRVSRGLTNDTYEVWRDGLRFALRIRAHERRAAEIDAQWEGRVLQAASAAGIAPPVECCEPDSGVLVTRWVAGRAWTRRAALAPANRVRVVRLIQRIQGLAPPQPARQMMPARWIAHYRALGCAIGAQLQMRADAHLGALADLPPLSPVLCHSDLHRFNLIDGVAGLIALDWEYAHVSDPYWDLAGWSCSNDLAAGERELLLAEHLGRRAHPEEAARLDLLCWLYDFVCLQWSESFLAVCSAPAALIIRSRAAVLAARLDARQRGYGS